MSGTHAVVDHRAWGVPLVAVERGPLVEAVHEGTVAVVDANGALQASAGDPRNAITYMRSAIKPIGSMAVVSTGAADRLGLGPADLAITSASHNGEPGHIEAVTALLSRLGVETEALVCGIHPPLRPDAADALATAGRLPDRRHNNCSGAHTGMLAIGLLGAGIDGYAEADHPAQIETVATLARLADLAPADVKLGLDDCGSPCHGISLYGMALAYARLMAPDDLEAPHRDAALRVREAMTSHPWLVAGTGRFDTDLMEVGGGRLIAKGGASGVQCIGVAGGIGIALKVWDGATGPSSPGQPTTLSSIEALRQLGLLSADELGRLEAHAVRPLRSREGRVAGQARTTFELRRAPA